MTLVSSRLGLAPYKLKRASRFGAIVGCLGLLLTGCSQNEKPSDVPPDCGLADPQIGQFHRFDGGSFVKGSDPVYPEEQPTIRLSIAPFDMQIHEVTIGQFGEFVEATGYVTSAERVAGGAAEPSGSAVFRQSSQQTGDPNQWTFDADATWRSSTRDEPSNGTTHLYPVVHVSLEDAKAYAHWAGGRLPNEVEWEYAALTGLADTDTPTSNAYRGGKPVANTWQGAFPVVNTVADGHREAAPVGCFAPDTNGLHDLIGNVWEWTDTPYGTGTNTIKGGSFLCADNFCRRYRPAARQGHETDFSSNHIGFRIVRDVQTDTN